MTIRGPGRLLLITAASVVMLAVAQPRPARAGGIDEVIDLLEQYLEVLDAVPDAAFQEQLGQLRAIIGGARRSYLELVRLKRALEELYPDNPDIFAIERVLEAVEERMEDRKERVEEAMTTAATVAATRPLVDARLTALHVLNLSPASIVAALQIGNELLHQLGTSLETLTRVTLEASQLEADQRMMEDWERQQSNAWMMEHYPNGLWDGDRTFEPEYLRRNF
jgi:hypothetical protein